MKKIISAIIIFLMVMILCFISLANNDLSMQTNNVNYGMPMSTKVGDIVYFGNYQQDVFAIDSPSGPKNLAEKTPIEWKVISVKDNAALLLSTYCLDAQPLYKENFNGKYFLNITFWQDSFLRHWINNDFMNEAFNDDEKNKILNSNILTNDNNFYISNGKSIITDKIFILSKDEIELLLKNKDDRIPKLTKYLDFLHNSDIYR